MKKTVLLFLLVLLAGVVSICQLDPSEKDIVKEQDIEAYLTTESFAASSGLVNTERKIAFWKNKLADDPGSMTYRSKLASAYRSRFGITKNSKDLHKADSLYHLAAGQPGGKTAGNLQALSSISVTKHRFADAEKYAFEALEIGADKQASRFMLYDALMERGEYELATKELKRYSSDYSFAYLIRLSKYMDHEGKLDCAIEYMEQAASLVKHSEVLDAWATANLSDMYGHANEIEKSYRHYQEVLEKENSGGAYLHSLKGIAWIAYAHDGNTDLANKVLHFVDSQLQSPDVKLTLAEIAEYEGDSRKKERYLKAFVDEAQKPEWFGMYDAYLIEIAATEMNNYGWAMRLAEKELENRPNPQVYDLQAWAFMQMGEKQKALDIIENKVSGKTFEPVPAYHMAMVYQANGMEAKAQKWFEEAMAAAYELGPVVSRKVEKQLSGL